MLDIRELERLTLATSPALTEQFHDGWVLRASGTDTRRANSVTQLEPGSLPLDEKIRYCETWYAHAAQPTTFRLTDALSPPELDDLLAARSYSVATPSHVMTMMLEQVETLQQDDSLQLRTATEGISDLHHLKGSDPLLAERDVRRQSQWTLPECNLALMQDGEIVACGLARQDGNYVGIFNMRTAATHRGQGCATRLLHGLLHWGRAQGARYAFLQVEQANAAGMALYRRAGFARTYDYHYRVQP